MANWYCMSNGQQFGPVDEPTLRQWIQQGRVQGTDLVLAEGMASWQAANTLPQFAAPVAVPPMMPLPLPGLGPMAYDRAFLPPHRGGMILTFGILSWFCCCIFGIVAWSMGSTDLRRMREGTMDPSGEGLTRAGKIIGMIHVILSLIALALMAVAVASDPRVLDDFLEGFREGMDEHILAPVMTMLR